MPYVGTVVNGIINSGQVKAGDSVYLGPDANGNWHSTAIKSIQRKRLVYAVISRKNELKALSGRMFLRQKLVNACHSLSSA